MITYLFKQPKILFVGINPHFGSYDRGVPFSNNKLFWYLLSEAGLIKEKREELRNDESLKLMYKEKFNTIYRLGLVNIINRPTRDVSELKKGEELRGRKKISHIIKTEMPEVVCFIGKITYEKYTGRKDFSFGWQDSTGIPRMFVMHFPLRGEAIIRVRELRKIKRAIQCRIPDEIVPMKHEFKVGDHVEWNSEAGRVRGTIKKRVTSSLKFKTYTVRASKEEPQYLIKSDKTDHMAMHKGVALKKIG